MAESGLIAEPRINYVTTIASLPSAARPNWLPLLPAACLPTAAVSWFFGGSQFLNDVTWFMLTVVMILMLLMELWAFKYRLGVGGIVLCVGTLLWFCWDYIANWSSISRSKVGALSGDEEVLAKATFYHMLFVTLMVWGLLIRQGRWLVKLIAKTPQPASPNTLLFLIILMFLLSQLPFFLFTRVPFYQAYWLEWTSFRSDWGSPAANIWTIGRTGRLNYNWGGYIWFLIAFDKTVGVLAIFYAIFMTRSVGVRMLCVLIWLMALARAFGSGGRSMVIALSIPVLLMLFIYLHSTGRDYWDWLRRKPIRAYLICFLLAVMFWTLMQIQGYNRRETLADATLTLEEYVDPKNNTMFSESLVIFQNVPDNIKPFYARFPGEGLVRCIPQIAADLVITMIPRALWPGKPIDQASNWVNMAKGGARNFGSTGATLSNGLVGFFYLRYGVAGVIEGALFFGWLIGVFERVVWAGRYKPILYAVGLGLLEFMLRSFRDLRWAKLHPLILALIALWCLSLFVQKARVDDRELVS